MLTLSLLGIKENRDAIGHISQSRYGAMRYVDWNPPGESIDERNEVDQAVHTLQDKRFLIPRYIWLKGMSLPGARTKRRFSLISAASTRNIAC